MIVLRLRAKVLKCLPAGPPPPLRFPEISAHASASPAPAQPQRRHVSPALPFSGLHSSPFPLTRAHRRGQIDQADPGSRQDLGWISAALLHYKGAIWPPELAGWPGQLEYLTCRLAGNRNCEFRFAAGEQRERSGRGHTVTPGTYRDTGDIP